MNLAKPFFAKRYLRARRVFYGAVAFCVAASAAAPAFHLSTEASIRILSVVTFVFGFSSGGYAAYHDANRFIQAEN